MATLIKPRRIVLPTKRDRLVAHRRNTALETVELQDPIMLNVERSRRFADVLSGKRKPPSAKLVKAVADYRRRVRSDLD